MVGFAAASIYDAIGNRRRAVRPRREHGLVRGLARPVELHPAPVDGTTIHEGQGNINWSYFDDPVFNDRMHAAEQLVGDERFDAFQRDRARPRPRRGAVGGHAHVQQQVLLLAANRVPALPERLRDRLCTALPAAGDHDRRQPRLRARRRGCTCRCDSRSEMDNTITVDYATADGTAHQGDDYVAASGTLTFAPHERVKYVDVTINDDGAGEPDETFFLNLSNESSGTMVDPKLSSRSPRLHRHRHLLPRRHLRLRRHLLPRHHLLRRRHLPATASPATASSPAATPASSRRRRRPGAACRACSDCASRPRSEKVRARHCAVGTGAQSALEAIAAGPRDRPDSAPGGAPAPRIPGQSRRRPALEGVRDHFELARSLRGHVEAHVELATAAGSRRATPRPPASGGAPSRA